MHLKVYRTVTGTNHTTAAAPPQPLKYKLSTHGTLGAKNMDGIMIKIISFSNVKLMNQSTIKKM